MRGGLPSGTSLLVSFARGLGVGDPVLDPVAKALLPVWLGRVADAPRHLGGAWHAPPFDPALFAAAGEPLKSTFEPRELASTIAPEWDVVYDEDARGWQMLTGSIANPQRSFLAERLAIVKRRA